MRALHHCGGRNHLRGPATGTERDEAALVVESAAFTHGANNLKIKSPTYATKQSINCATIFPHSYPPGNRRILPSAAMEFFQSSQFGAKAEKLMKKHRVPGLSVAVIHGNKTDQRAFGFASVKDGKKCTSDTLFDIASSSKVLTAASVALLVEDDKNHPNVAWDTPVSKLLPEDFVMSDPEYTKNVTVEDILGHRSGLAT